MFRALIATLTLLLAMWGDPQAPKAQDSTSKTPVQPSLRSASMDRYPASAAFDEQAEAQLLRLVNQDRALAGLPVLEFNEGLTQAARKHAFAMAQQRQLSHQFAGEPALGSRIAEASDLRLDQAGENVALDLNVDSAQDHLMASPPHRRNLLDPGFNVAGFAVVRSDGRLYVVQDFAHRLTAYSLHQSEAQVADALNQWRMQHKLGALVATAPAEIRDAACGMAQTNMLNTKTIRALSEGRSLITYTQSQPQVLPNGIDRVVSSAKLKQVAIGVCFGRSSTYPNGTYWVVLSSQ